MHPDVKRINDTLLRLLSAYNEMVTKVNQCIQGLGNLSKILAEHIKYENVNKKPVEDSTRSKNRPTDSANEHSG